MDENKLLKMFNVNSFEELEEFIKNNPEDNRVKEFKSLLEMLRIDTDYNKKIFNLFKS